MFKTLKELNEHLVDKSYINGYTPSSLDVDVFEQFKDEDFAEFVHALRWRNHIASFSDEEKAKWEKIEKKEEEEKEDEDEDFDLFGDDDSEDEAAKEELRKKAEESKKATKKRVDKSRIVIDVKVYDDETDLEGEIQKYVRSIQMEGLLWGESAIEEIAFGAQKLRITAVIVDDLVSADDLCEQIMEHDDVQSADVVSFNKL